jgi:hypothetical protein
MFISTLFGGNYPYLEYAQVCACNTAAFQTTANTATTVTLDTKVSDIYNIATNFANNQLTLPAGTYFYEIYCNLVPTNYASTDASGNFGLYNVTDSTWITRQGPASNSIYASTFKIIGQFTITSSKAFALKANMGYTTFYVKNASVGYAPYDNSDSTPGSDQRSTIKLWKIA